MRDIAFIMLHAAMTHLGVRDYRVCRLIAANDGVLRPDRVAILRFLLLSEGVQASCNFFMASGSFPQSIGISQKRSPGVLSGQTIRWIVLVAVIFAGDFSSAQASSSPKAFLASIYKHYENGGGGINIGDPGSSQYFSSSLIALVKADAKAAGPGNVGAIDADPICGCQDWDGIWGLAIDVKFESAESAEASISFSLSPPQRSSESDLRHLTVKVVSGNRGWRIDNVIDLTDPKNPFDLRKALANDIELNRRSQMPKR